MSTTHTEAAEAPITASFRGSLVSSWMIARALIQLNPATRWLRRIGWILIMVGFAGAVVSDSALTTGLIAMTVGLMVVVIMAMNPLIALWAGRGTHRLEQGWRFSASGIRCTAGQFVSEIDWAAVTKIVDTRRYVVLAFSDRVQSFIPKKAFTTPNPVELLEALRSRAGDQIGSLPEGEAHEPLLRITFSWTVNQLYRASVAVSKEGARLWLIYLLCAGVGVTIALPTIRYAIETGTALSPWALVYPMGLPAFAFLAGRLGGYWWARSHLRSSYIAGEQQIVEIFDTEIRAHGRGFNAVIPFASIDRLAESEEFILLFIAKLQAVAIPKAAMQSDQLQWFAQFMRSAIADDHEAPSAAA